MGYWMCVTNEKNWQIIRDKRIWGVSKRRKKIIGQVKPGDLLVFYVKPKRIGGIFKAVSKPFESDEEIFTPVNGEIFPYRVRLKAVYVPMEPIDFEGLIPKLSFTKGRRWSVMLRRGMFEISEEDYKIISSTLKRGVL